MSKKYEEKNLILPGYEELIDSNEARRDYFNSRDGKFTKMSNEDWERESEELALHDVNRYNVFPFIQNPSDKVIDRYIESRHFNIHHKFDNDTYKKIIVKLTEMGKYYKLCSFYSFLFDECDLKELISDDYKIFSKILLPNDNIIKHALIESPENLKYVDQTDELILYTIKNKKSYKCIFSNLINWDLYEDNEIWCKITDYFINKGDISHLPSNLMTRELIDNYDDFTYEYDTFMKNTKHLLIQSDYDRIFKYNFKTIECIPHEYQTKKMIDYLFCRNKQKYCKYLEQTERVLNRLKTVKKEYLPDNLKNWSEYIGEQHEFALYLSRISLDLITSKLLKILFLSEFNVPKRNRLKYIKYYKGDRLLAILKARPCLIEMFEDKSDIMIKTALENDGCTLKFLTEEEQTKERVKIACDNNINAVEHIK
mgnify:CR=1 FL=1